MVSASNNIIGCSHTILFRAVDTGPTEKISLLSDNRKSFPMDIFPYRVSHLLIGDILDF